MPEAEPRLILLHEEDNVFTVASTIDAMQEYYVGSSTYVSTQPIPIGFKIARCLIHAGEKIIKYGVPIGSSTREILPGEIVHTHNLKSDYLPTYQRGEGEGASA